MTRTHAEEEALSILARIGNVSQEELRPDLHLVRDLALDSPTTLDLLMTMEEKLDMEISEIDAATFITVDDVLAFVRKNHCG